MVCIDVCGWCKNYYGLIDGWKPSCKAYPNGQPSGFCSSKSEMCNGSIGLEVKEDLKEEFDKLFK